jgi:acetyl esterase/lipase
MTTPFYELDWRKLSRQELDLGLNNGVAVPESADIVAGWDQRSALLRAQYPKHLDLRYGPRERNRIDFLKMADGGPTLLFIHGGYWQARAKETFSVFATGPMAHGINVALIGYTLAPDASWMRSSGKSTPALIFLLRNCRHSAAMLPALSRQAGLPAGISPRWRCRIRM